MERTAPLHSQRGRRSGEAVALDRRIAGLIERAALTKDTNGFFRLAKTVKAVDVGTAAQIAHNWGAISKTFMFTTIEGLGMLARQARQEDSPAEGLLRTLQTGFCVIGDDLTNAMPVFAKVAPKGVGGIHYIWWEHTILRPLLARMSEVERHEALVLSPGTRSLIDTMQACSRTTIGTAVQLRVVEEIALEIAVAFRQLFSKVVAGASVVFRSNDDLVWMNAHIRAEVVHSRQVSDSDAGMTILADSASEEGRMLATAADYVDVWRRTLADFERTLQRGTVRRQANIAGTAA